MGKPIAARGGCPAYAGQRTGVQLQGVARVVKSDAVAQLRKAQADYVAPGTEGA